MNKRVAVFITMLLLIASTSVTWLVYADVTCSCMQTGCAGGTHNCTWLQITYYGNGPTCHTRPSLDYCSEIIGIYYLNGRRIVETNPCGPNCDAPPKQR